MTSSILFIAPRFYEIESKIKFLLEESGYRVVFIENKILKLDYHSPNSKLRLFRRIYFSIFSPREKYIAQELDKVGDTRFDILFSINAFIICPYLYRRLKKINPDLYSVLYLWDSFSLYNWSREVRYFDRVITFDLEDSKKYNLEYKPNFWLNSGLDLNQSAERNDLFFVGKFNKFRLYFIEEIIPVLENSGIKYFIKLWPGYQIFPHNKFIYNLLKNIRCNSGWIKNYLLNYEIFEGILKKDLISLKNLGYSEMQCVMHNSNVVLDLPFAEQNGYSHRVIEALATGKKVLTTNKSILKENFYNPQQIKILDLLKADIDPDWIREKSVFPIDSLFIDLELSAWLKSIVNVETL